MVLEIFCYFIIGNNLRGLFVAFDYIYREAAIVSISATEGYLCNVTFTKLC